MEWNQTSTSLIQSENGWNNFPLEKDFIRYVSKINKNSEEYLENMKQYELLIDDLDKKLEESRWEGKEAHVKRYRDSGHLLARERIEKVLDEDSPFLELCPLAGYGQNGTTGGNIVAGIGLVSGVECMITSNVYTNKGGSINEPSLIKSGRINEIIMKNRLPVIAFIQSAGADLREQDKVFHKGGAGFRDLARRSKMGIPSIAVVFGSSTAGGAYIPGMSDYTVLVKNQAKVYLGGPPLVKMATGEIVDSERLGGADMHSKLSGVSDFLAMNEMEAILKARQIVGHLNYKKMTSLPPLHTSLSFEEPFYDPQELLGIISTDIRQPFDAKEVIARVVDGSKFTEFKPLYGPQLVCAFAYIHGIPVGILANNGVLFVDTAQKGSQFIHLCNQSNTPIIFFHNITGFMVGQKYEQNGIIKYGSQLINAVSNSQVPAITIIMGASYGAGNYAMAGRAYDPRFLFSYPNSKCSVMGPDQLAGVLDIVLREAAERSGNPINEDFANSQKEMMKSMVNETSDVYYTSSRCIDDGVIDPRDTRAILAICLSVIYNTPVVGGNLGGVSRL